MVARSSIYPIKNCDVHPSAAIAPSKLGTGALPSGTTVPAAQVTAGELPTGVSLADSIPLSKLPNLARVVGIGAVPEKVATKVAGSLAGNSATHAFTIETDPIDVPRNVEVVFAVDWNGGDVTVTGTDQWGAVQTETFTGASGVTRVGSKVFATITGAVKTLQGSNAAGATIGTGAKIGCGVDISDSSGVCIISSGAIDAACVFNSTYDSFAPSVEPDDETYIIIVNV